VGIIWILLVIAHWRLLKESGYYILSGVGISQ
jgi:hypothetical protein